MQIMQEATQTETLRASIYGKFLNSKGLKAWFHCKEVDVDAYMMGLLVSPLLLSPCRELND